MDTISKNHFGKSAINSLKIKTKQTGQEVFCTTLWKVLESVMRKRNVERMTVVEQLVNIREQVCIYACKYKEDICRKYHDEIIQKTMLQQYCHGCPLTKLHYDDAQ